MEADNMSIVDGDFADVLFSFSVTIVKNYYECIQGTKQYLQEMANNKTHI